MTHCAPTVIYKVGGTTANREMLVERVHLQGSFAMWRQSARETYSRNLGPSTEKVIYPFFTRAVNTVRRRVSKEGVTPGLDGVKGSGSGQRQAGPTPVRLWKTKSLQKGFRQAWTGDR